MSSQIHSLWQTIKQRIQQWVKPDNHSPVVNAALDLTRSKSELMLENALLRQQLIIYRREIKRPRLTWRDRALIVFLTNKLRGWKDAVIIVKPDTCPGRKLYPTSGYVVLPNSVVESRS